MAHSFAETKESEKTMKNCWIGVTLIMALAIGCGGQDPPATTPDAAPADAAPADAAPADAAPADSSSADAPSAGSTAAAEIAVDDDLEISRTADDVPLGQETSEVAVAANNDNEDPELTPEQIKNAINEKLREAMQARDEDQVLAVLEEGRAQLPKDEDIGTALLRFSLQRDLQMAQANLVMDEEGTKFSDEIDKEALASNFLKTALLAEDVIGAERSDNPQLAQMQSFVVFNKARAFGLQGNSDDAIIELRRAYDLGFDQFPGLAKDPFFAGIAENPQFTGLIDEMTEKLREQFRETAREEIAQSPEMEFDFELPDLENNPVKLADFAGKVVIVDFWGTWCPPCRMEIPHFIELKEKYKDDLEIVGISYENGDEAEKVKIVSDFVAENGVNYPCVMGDVATQEAVQITGFPTTLFIDRDGKVRLKIVGYHPYLKLESYVAALIDEGDEG